MTPEQEIQRSNDAKAIIENPLYQESYTELRKELINELLDTPLRDTEAREKIYMMVKMLDSVQTRIQSIMETGTILKE
tara:strand:- start:1730 stop:1963 length:234 start_codon:yes stop_codon:yes gene_type:complete